MNRARLVPLVAAASWVTYVALAAVFWAATNVGGAVADPPSWAHALGDAGGWSVLPAGTVVLGLALVLVGRRNAAVFLVGAVAGAGVLAYASKVALQIAGADDDGGRIAGFPSAHVVATVAFTGALTVLVWRISGNWAVRALVAGTAVTISVMMGWARVAEGKHAVVDVLGGAVLGVAWLATWMLALMSIKSLRAWLAVALAVALVGFVLLAVGYADEPLASVDREVSEWVVASMPSWAESLARPPSWLGGWIGLTMLGVLLCTVLVRERAWLDVGFFLAAFAGSQLIVAALKEVFDRPRPQLGSAVELSSSASFPSGHATAGVASLGAAAVLAAERLPSPRARIGLWAIVFAGGLAVGASRIVLNVHYVTDMLAGWCLGLAWLAACLLARDMLAARSG
jgi:membrane-associated phospholipid phosphatase